MYKKPEIVSEQFKKNKLSKRKGKDSGQLESQQIKEPKQLEITPNKELKTSSSKKKQKFSSIYGTEGKDVVTLPGRHPCICQASKHKLINNCMRCGRIVCEQEGSGPCFTCNNLVCSKEEQEIIIKGSKQSEKLYTQLIRKGNGNLQQAQNIQDYSGLEKAIEHKNKLLEYDRTVEKRTLVIDDESDYYCLDSNTWLSPVERKELKKKEEEIFAKKHKSRNEMKITLDFAGRKVYETDDNDLDNELKDFKLSKGPNNQERTYVNPTISVIPKYENSEDDQYPKKELTLWDENLWLRKMRIQDTELQKMSDEGMCLSVQQPWASFLISGIKQHEGRTWYTSHRGRLWIHAGAKVPTQQEILQLENSTRIIKGASYIKFPEQYPTGCLLGCVDVIDCLPQEEYQLQVK
ncbi:activating signal cointegrator 1-like [Centruroides sculpturatus]|uniref:activating signal cointegrator 1-like n=1 Tax=Centruroides sculpturatus TaxID=218467 RepID=UPI000C6D0E77|nr:activating signal cointegrator 1-like [Centruroides sculpturatus]